MKKSEICVWNRKLNSDLYNMVNRFEIGMQDKKTDTEEFLWAKLH